MPSREKSYDTKHISFYTSITLTNPSSETLALTLDFDHPNPLVIKIDQPSLRTQPTIMDTNRKIWLPYSNGN
ncbi:hypothetical protein CISIN_1g035187mg [Citrus sinensis]|uniref:Uncharacterized protein n=1 Tax=Citrus sinensis TaxID=2711 RepID=A0A067DVK8_CITSI|nr:hypothetical protein CISIN_1g035187mg [Citrus sinensis]